MGRELQAKFPTISEVDTSFQILKKKPDPQKKVIEDLAYKIFAFIMLSVSLADTNARKVPQIRYSN